MDVIQKLQTLSNPQDSSQPTQTGKRLKVGLNGFGRIGRAFTRISLQKDAFDIVAINTRKPEIEMMAYLLQYDSLYRKFGMEVKPASDGLMVNDKKIMALQNSDPAVIPWDQYGVDVVVDATGAFTTKADLEKHLHGTVKKVVLTAPSKDDETPHIVLGVNEDTFDWKNNNIISNASCTTNCSAPMFKVMQDAFGITSGFLTTDHAYTQSESLEDDANGKPDRSRAAAINTIPSTTGAAKAVVKVIPELKGKIDGMSLRVPVPTVSFTDISLVIDKPTTIEEVNQLFKTASETTMKGIMGYETVPLVSSDYIGSPLSVIFDANYTKVINGNFIKIFGWYDNEWGYSNRLVDLVQKLQNYV
jgi:glyceraldehyde 3-phosphate dehydrogenase